MNKSRRTKISNAVSKLMEAGEIIDSVLDEEQDAMDNIPENFQESERYSEMEDAVDILSEAADQINEAIESLSGIV